VKHPSASATVKARSGYFGGWELLARSGVAGPRSSHRAGSVDANGDAPESTVPLRVSDSYASEYW